MNWRYGLLLVVPLAVQRGHGGRAMRQESRQGSRALRGRDEGAARTPGDSGCLEQSRVVVWNCGELWKGMSKVVCDWWHYKVVCSMEFSSMVDEAPRNKGS